MKFVLKHFNISSTIWYWLCFAKIFSPIVVFKLIWFYIYLENVFWLVTVFRLDEISHSLGYHMIYDPNLFKLGMVVNKVW